MLSPVRGPRRSGTCARSSIAIAASRPTGPIVVVEDATLAQVAAISAAAARLRAAGRRRAAGADARVSDGSSARTCSATWARSATRRSSPTTTLKSGDIVGQAGLEKVYNALLMGKDGARARRRQQRRPRDPATLEESRADRGQAAAAHDRLRRAEGRSRTASTSSGFNGAAVILDPQHRRSARPSRSRAGLRSERVCRRHRSRDVGVAEHATTCGRCRTAPSRDATRRARRSRWRSATGGARRGRHHAGLQGALRRRTPTFYGRYFKCWKKGGPRHDRSAPRASSSRATSTSTPSATWSASTSIHKWATLLGLGVKSGIDLPNEVAGPRAVDRSGSERARRTRSGTRARRSRCRSGRARCR